MEVEMKRQRFPVMLSNKERQTLMAIAREEVLPQAAIIRRLIRQEGIKRGLWSQNPHPNISKNETRYEPV
jgi:hypothetical protein